MNEIKTINFETLSNDELMYTEGGSPQAIAVAFVGLCFTVICKGFEAGRAIVRDVRNH